MEAIVSEVLQAVDDYVPDVLAFDDADAPLAFALSAIRRMADLVDAELTLALAERHSVTRTLGRPVIELWLYANDLLLDGEAALDRLFAEDAGHQSRLEHGRQMVWDHLESKRAGGIDPRDPNFVRKERSDPNIEVLSQRVRSLRESRGLGGGIAEVRYQQQNRMDSNEDIHVSVDHLFRYMEPIAGSFRILSRPLNELDITPFRGIDSVLDDARLLVDALGVYLEIAGRHSELEELKRRIATSTDGA